MHHERSQADKKPLTMKAFITKYALTKGIIEIEAVEFKDSPGMIENTTPSILPITYFHGEGRDWNRTREGAVKSARLMRDKKLDSLRKQILHLERLEF